MLVGMSTVCPNAGKHKLMKSATDKAMLNGFIFSLAPTLFLSFHFCLISDQTKNG